MWFAVPIIAIIGMAFGITLLPGGTPTQTSAPPAAVAPAATITSTPVPAPATPNARP
jgi:hypothetical protein